MIKNKVLQSIFECLLYAVGFLVLNYIMIKFGIPALLICGFIGLFFLYRYAKKNNVSKGAFLGYLTTLLFMLAYICMRVGFGAVVPNIEKYFSLNSVQLSSFVSIFSLTYGAGQLLAGKLLGQYGLLAHGISGILAAACTLGTYFFGKSYNISFLLRAGLGIFCSMGSIGVMSYLSKNWPASTFNFMSGISSASAMLFSVVIGGIFTKLIASGSINFLGVHGILGILLLLSGIGILIMYFFNKKNEKVEKKEEKNQITFKESMKVMFSFKYIMSFVWTSFCCALMYLSHMFDKLIHFQLGFKSGAATSAMGITGGVLILALPNLITRFPNIVKYVYPIVSWLQVLGLAIIYLRRNCIYGIITGMVLITICGFAHMVLPMVINKNHEKRGDASVFFGIMNAGTMAIGCWFFQFLIGFVVKYFKGNVLYALLLIGSITSIITLISSYFVINFNDAEKLN